MNRHPISVEVDDVYVLVTPLDPDTPENRRKSAEEGHSVLKAADGKLSEKVAKEITKEVAKEATKESSKGATKEVDKGALTDFSDAFQFATLLANNFEFRLNRLHVRLEGNPKSPIPVFSLGVGLESIVLDTMEVSEATPKWNVRKNFRMDGLTLYWCLNDQELLAGRDNDCIVSSMKAFFLSKEEAAKSSSVIQYDPDDRLLDDLDCEVKIIGDLRRVEDRRRGVQDSLQEMCRKLNVTESSEVDSKVLALLNGMDLAAELKQSRKEFPVKVRNLLSQEKDFTTSVGLRAREMCETLWEVHRTPLPLLRVQLDVFKVDLEIEKSQYENIACFADDFLNSLPSDTTSPKSATSPDLSETSGASAASSSAIATASEQNSQNPEVEDIKYHYVFGVIPFACFMVNYLLSSYLRVGFLLLFLSAFPIALYQMFFSSLLILLFLIASVALLFFRLKKSTDELNKKVDSECHYRNMLVDASVELHSFEFRLNNDMIPNKATEHIMALCVNNIKVQATVSSAMITAGVSVQDVHIRDTVSSSLQGDTRYMMCVCDVDDKGCPNDMIVKPLLVTEVVLVPASSHLYALSKQDIYVNVVLGQVNIVLSRVLIYSLLRFITPSPKVKELLKKAAIKADEKTKQLKEYSDSLVAAPPKPIPSNWERKSIVVNLTMDAAQIMLDTEGKGLVMRAGVYDIQTKVEICAAKISLFFNIHDASVKDLTSGCGLYSSVVSISHDPSMEDNAKNDFIDAGVKLYNDDRWPSYPGFSLEAGCRIGAPILTVRMRFISEVLNYIMDGPIMDGLKLLSEPEPEPEPELKSISEPKLTANGNLPELEAPSKEANPEVATQIVGNVLGTAKAIGLSYINMNAEQSEDTRILEHLQGITQNLKKFILPNPNDDLVPTELPRVDVMIANTKLIIPKSSTSCDYLAMRLGCIKISNTDPERKQKPSDEIRKDSVVYTLNKVSIGITGVSLYSSLDNHPQTIMGSIDLTVTAIVAVKTEASIDLSHIVLAFSEDQVLALIHLLTDNLKEEPVVMLPPPPPPSPVAPTSSPSTSAKSSKVASDDVVPVPQHRGESAKRKSNRLSAHLSHMEEEALQAELDRIDNCPDDDSFLPRSDSTASLDSSIDLSMLPVIEEKEKPPVEHNSNIADRIHVNLLFEGVTIELFRGNHGYDGIQSSKTMRSKVGTVEGSIAAVSIDDLSIQAYIHNMDISAAVSLKMITVRDSRPESPLYSNFRTLLRVGEENMPAFSVIVELTNKPLREINDVVIRNDNKQDEVVMDIAMSMFVGQVAVLPSPWIFDMLDWATAVGARVSEAFTEAASSVSKSKPALSTASAAAPVIINSECIEGESVKPAEETNDASLIPNITVALHMQRMAVYLCEEWKDETVPVFLFCFGVELDAHVTPFMDVKTLLSVNTLRGLRSNSELRLLVTDVQDAIYPFEVDIDVSLTDFLKNIAASVKGSGLTIRLGILDAKLFLNFITNLLPKAEEDDSTTSSKVRSPPSLENSPVSMGMLSDMDLEDDKVKSPVHAKEDVVKEEPVAPRTDVMHIRADVLFEKISFILVNDAKEFDLPVLQFSVNQIKVGACMGNNLFAHVNIAFYSDYYKASQAIWEPFMEKWEMGVHVKQVKDKNEHDIYMYENGFGGNNNKNNEDEEDDTALHVNIDAPRILQMNLTATLISSLLDVLNDFLTCESGKRKMMNNFYVTVKNSTGYNLKYFIKDDGGININMLEMEQKKIEEEAKDHVMYAGVVDFVDSYRTHCRWLELHSMKPHIRLFKHVPLLQNDEFTMRHNLVMQTDSIEKMDATCGHIFPIACRLKYRDSYAYIEQFDSSHQESLIQSMDTSLKTCITVSSTEMERIHSSYAPSWFPVPFQGVNTTVPAHPSLTLLFLKKEYRKISDRKIALRLENYDQIYCLVDRERVVYERLKDSKGNTLDVLVHNRVIKGRKVIDVTSQYCVENLTEENLEIAFADSSANMIATKITMAHRDIEYCPLSVMRSAEVQIGSYHMRLSKYLLENTIQPCINVGSSSSPKYFHVSIQSKDIYDIYNKEFVTLYHITLSPVMCLANLLPVPLDYQIYLNQEMKYSGRLAEGQSIKYNGVPLLAESEDEAAVRISVRPDGFKNFSTFEESMIAFPQEKQQSVMLDTLYEGKLRLSYKAIESPTGVLTMQLYCDFWVINRTGEDILIHEKGSKASKPLLLPGVSVPTLATDQYSFEKEELLKPVMFSYLDPDKRSKVMEFKTPQSEYCNDGVVLDVIGTSVRFCMPSKQKDRPDNCKRIFGVIVENAPLVFALTNIVIITPGMFITNRTKYDLSLRLGDKETNQVTMLPAGGILPYHCPEPNKKIELSVKCDTLKSEWTEPFDTTKEEQAELLKLENGDDNHLLRMRGGMNMAQREIVFDFADSFNVILYKLQQKKKSKFLSLGKKEEEVSVISLLKECAQAEAEGEDLSQAVERIESKISNIPDESDNSEEEEEEEVGDLDSEDDAADPETVHVNVNFGGVGISLVDKFPREILYMCMESLQMEFIMCESNKISLGMTILKFQIDSNLPNTKYNVLLGSTEAGEVNPEYDPENPGSVPEINPLFQLSISLPYDQSVTVIEYLGLYLQPMICAVDSPILTALLSVVSDLALSMDDSQEVDGSKLLKECHAFTRANVVSGKVGKSYILAEYFILQPINIKFSYRNDPSAPLSAALLPQDPRLMPLIAFLNTIVNVLGNMENTPINLRSFFLSNYYADMYAFIMKVVGFYGTEVMKQFYKIIGSLNMIGNPVELVGNVGDGIKCFFTEPVQGLMKGPRDFVGGLGKGTTKLLSMTSFGILNSLTKITGAAGDGLAALAFSEEYQADRAAGKSNLVHGIWSGATGIFTETGAGFKEKGVLGAAAGLGKGIIGAAAKTATGAIDSVTNVVNTVKDIAHKEKVVEPLRAPRYIPLDDVLEPYNHHLSSGNALLVKANRGTGIELEPNERYVIHCAVDNGSNIILLTTHKLVLMSPSAKILGVSPFSNLEIHRNGQELEVIPKDSKQKNEVMRNLSAMVNTVTSKVDGELKLKQVDLLFESEKLALEIERYCTNVDSMTKDAIAESVRRMLPEIHSQASGSEEDNEPKSDRNAPDLRVLKVKSARLIDKKREEVNETGVKKKITKYKLEVVSQGENPALWNVFIRYGALE